MYLPLIILRPELSFRKLSQHALKCLLRNYHKKHFYGSDMFLRKHHNGQQEMQNVEFLQIKSGFAGEIISESLRKNPNRPFPYPDYAYQCYVMGTEDKCCNALVKVIGMELE